jgi:hypothetical protein
LRCWEAGDPTTQVPLERAIDDLVAVVAERNFDFYEEHDGRLVKA